MTLSKLLNCSATLSGEILLEYRTLYIRLISGNRESRFFLKGTTELIPYTDIFDKIISISITPVDKDLGGIIFVSGDNLIMNSFGTNSKFCKFFASSEIHKINRINIISGFLGIPVLSVIVTLLALLQV